MDAWLARKLKQTKMIFGHRVGSIPTNVLQVTRQTSPANRQILHRSHFSEPDFTPTSFCTSRSLAVVVLATL